MRPPFASPGRVATRDGARAWPVVVDARPALRPVLEADLDDWKAGASRRDRVTAWVVGLAAALVVVAPGLRAGMWLNVDLVVTPVTPVPSGVWGLGPELPRRVPFALPFAWLSSVVPGELAWKVAVVVALASTVAGTWRLVARWDPASPRLVRVAAGLMMGVGPFAVTRAGVGHLGLTFALAVLPWALPTLLRPADRPARTALWAVALGACGPFGGTFALPVVALSMVGTAGWRRGTRSASVRALVGTLVAQGPWLVPTVVVAALGTDIGSSSAFATDGSGPGGVLRLLAGHGFWLRSSQVGVAQSWEVPALGVALAAFALAGARAVPADVRRPAVLVAAVGLASASASAVPGIAAAAAFLTDLPVLAAVRESQRLLGLYLIVALPAAALGAARLGRAVRGAAGDVVVAAPLAIAVVLGAPGAWGAAGGFDVVSPPNGWEAVRQAVRADPGPTLVLPWRSYPVLAVEGRPRAVNPIPYFLGGDVLVKTDPGFGDDSREAADPREDRAEALAARLTAGEADAEELWVLGVRWVVDVHVVGEPFGVVEGRGLRSVVETSEITLHRVEGWAAGRSQDGEPIGVGRSIPPIISGPGGGGVVAAPASRGWWRGGRRAGAVDGQLELPGGSGPLLYPASAVVLVADGAAIALALVAGRRLRSRRSLTERSDAEVPAPSEGC